MSMSPVAPSSLVEYSSSPARSRVQDARSGVPAIVGKLTGRQAASPPTVEQVISTSMSSAMSRV